MAKSTPTTVFTWKIANLEREIADGFVFTAHYTVDANDGTYSSGAYGSVGFERPENLIPFKDLKEFDIVKWVKESLGEEKVKEIEAAILDRLAEQSSPTRSAGLPWA